jgi:hypothetical protein
MIKFFATGDYFKEIPQLKLKVPRLASPVFFFFFSPINNLYYYIIKGRRGTDI